MAASKFSSCVAMAAAVAALSSLSDGAHADYSFRFPYFSSSSSSSSTSSSNPSSYDQTANAKTDSEAAAADDPRGSGFDAEALERGAKALREINRSPFAKEVFDLMRKQEQTRLAEVAAEKAHYEATQAQKDIERQRKLAEEQRNIVEQQKQAKAQMQRYEDDLARKRMQTDHEAQRRHNVELVKMQEESSIRKEQARRASEEQIIISTVRPSNNYEHCENKKFKVLSEARNLSTNSTNNPFFNMLKSYVPL